MRRTLTLLTPSFSSTIIVGLLSFLVLGSSGWSYVHKKQLFSDSIFGVYSFKDLLFGDNAWTIQDTLLRGKYTYFVLVIVAAIVVGMSVYGVLQGLGAAMHTTSDELHQMQDHTHRGVASEAFKRLMVRICSMCGWGIYIAIFLSSIVPITIVMVQAGLDGLDSFRPSTTTYFLLAFALLSLSLHLHVIFARLCALRVRLFGGDMEVEDSTLPRI
jgi:hypothetical protein